MDEFDVVIIGGGTAGLGAAVALARSRRSVLVLDAGQPRNATSGHVHNFLTRDGASPAEIMALGREEVLGYGGQVRSAPVSAVRRDGDFIVETDTGTVGARRVLLATGAASEAPVPRVRLTTHTEWPRRTRSDVRVGATRCASWDQWGSRDGNGTDHGGAAARGCTTVLTAPHASHR